MQQLISSLLTVEELARDVYAAAAMYFAEDRPFAVFLRALARDEAFHAATLRRAVGMLDRVPHRPVQAFEFGAERTSRVRDRVCDILERIRGGTLHRREMVDCVLEIEMSEWNDFFLYVVDVLKGQDREFQHMASRMQSHKEEVVRFCRRSSDAAPLSHQLSEAPAVWTKKTLVVDDELAITNMLTRVLRRTVDVEVANDGKQALEMVSRSHYDAIISDLDMPLVNGLEFLQAASARDRSVKERFLLFTADLSEDRARLLSDTGVRFLHKPASIASIRDALEEILRGSA